jgi:1-acyl-sn-glycerol-3-phosphate acyltransferase
MRKGLEVARMGVILLRFIGGMILQGMRAPQFWWWRRQGKHAQVEAKIEELASRWARQILRSLRCQVVVEGLEHVPRTGPLIVVSNHQSMLDIPALLGYVGRGAGFLAKAELYRIPVLNFWMRQIHCARIDRADIAGSGKLLERLSGELKAAGGCLILFPEGTRTRHPDGEIGPFRRGSLRLAQAQELPILPVALDGTRYLVNPEAMFASRAGRREVRIRILPPRVTRREASALENKRFMDELRATIVSNWNEIRVNWQH